MEKVYTKFNSYLADLVVEYLKLHDLHWNVKGPQFVEVHKYTESVYENLSEKFDEVAERMIMSGVQPISTIEEYLKATEIKEVGKKLYRDTEVLGIVLADIKFLRSKALELRKEFDEAGLIAETNLLDAHVEYYDKEIWFLEAMAQ